MNWLGWISIALLSGIVAVGLLVWWAIFTSKDSVALGQELDKLIGDARVLGLPARDAANAAEMLEQAEFQEAFDIIVVQLAEYAVPISDEYYQRVQAVAEKLKLPEQSYVFAKNLIT